MQTQPAKICSSVGLCTFDGAHGVRYELWIQYKCIQLHFTILQVVITSMLVFATCYTGAD
jgi:hypothetical protein